MSCNYVMLRNCIPAVLAGFISLTTQAEIVINRPLELPQTPSEALLTQDSGYSLVMAYDSYHNKQYQDAYEEFEFFAKKQDPKALMASAYLLFSGYISKDFAKASEYLARVASLKYARAVYLQGLLEANRNSGRLNKSAERFINQAAVMGDYVAANALANFHFQHGNYALAQRWNEKAVELGSPAARQNQRIILNSSREVSTQPTISKEVVNSSNTGVIGELRQRSLAGEGGASYDLAVRYHKGIGVAVNFGEAIRLYQLAAKQGSKEAKKVLPILLSRRSPSGNLNSMWMQEMSNMMPSPVIVQEAPTHKMTEHNLAERAAEQEKISANIQPLQEDDPLDGLLRLAPNQ